VRGNFGLTVSGQALGSPNFMPPEQTSGKSGKVGPACDVYGIGALLYHLLTGRPPFQAETIEEVLLLLRDTDPVSLRLLNGSVPRDLETICMKCLQKDPERRYRSAQELADELGRFLAREPIRARPVRLPEKLWRWARRKPVLASLVVLVHIVGAIGLLGILWQWQRAERNALAERRERNAGNAVNLQLQTANRRLAETVSLLELQRAEDLFRAGDAASGVAHLAAMLRSHPSNHIAANRIVSALVHRNWALPAAPPMRHDNQVETARFSPDAWHVLSASGDKTARIWDSATGVLLSTMVHEDRVFLARYSSD
jgi:hypothetical protein